MHALTFMHARLEDEERVRKEGYDRCFKHRIRQIYTKHLPEFETDLVEQDIHEAGDNVRDFYMALCASYGEIAGIPMWLPPDDRPDWFPKFLREKEEGPDEDTETDLAVGTKPSKWKVQITPAKKKAKPPVPAAPSAALPAVPPAPCPVSPPAPNKKLMVLTPKLLLGRPPMPAMAPEGAVPPMKGVPAPPPKPAEAPMSWWPAPPPPPVRAEHTKGKGKGKGKVVPKKDTPAPKPKA